MKTVEHKNTCQPDENQNEIAISIHKIHEVASTSVEPMTKIYKENIRPLKEKGFKVPQFDNVKCSLYNARKRKLKVSKTIFKCIEEVQVPATFEKFLVADYQYEHTRLLIFCTKEAKQLLKSVKEYFVDATFKTSPRPFPQLLSILGDLRSTSQTTSVIPLIHVLMSDKKESTYAALFDILKTKFPDWCPTIFHADFEIAVANALRCFFPHISVKKCYFHYCQSLWRKAKSIGLKSKLHKRIVGLCTALPFTPLELVKNGWEYIKIESNELSGEKMKQFIAYMARQWLNDEQYIADWNIVGQRHRTNNVCECWHSQLNKHVNKNYVTILKLLTVLFNQKEINIETKRRIDQTDKDNFIISCQLKLLNGEISLGHFLETLR